MFYQAFSEILTHTMFENHWCYQNSRILILLPPTMNVVALGQLFTIPENQFAHLYHGDLNYLTASL